MARRFGIDLTNTLNRYEIELVGIWQDNYQRTDEYYSRRSFEINEDNEIAVKLFFYIFDNIKNMTNRIDNVKSLLDKKLYDEYIKNNVFLNKLEHTESLNDLSEEELRDGIFLLILDFTCRFGGFDTFSNKISYDQKNQLQEYIDDIITLIPGVPNSTYINDDGEEESVSVSSITEVNLYKIEDNFIYKISFESGNKFKEEIIAKFGKSDISNNI